MSPPLDRLVNVTVRDKRGKVTKEKALYDGFNFQNEDGYYYYQINKKVMEWKDDTERH